MRYLLVIGAVLGFSATTGLVAQQATPAVDPALVGTWTLESMEQNVGAAQGSRVGSPRGLLVFDSAGHAFEAVVRGTAGRAAGAGPAAGRGAGAAATAATGAAAPAAPPAAAPAATPAAAQPAAAQPANTFSTFAGFWGGYRVDGAKNLVTYKPEGAVSPNLMGREFSRSYSITGTRLTVTSEPGEPHLQGTTRWVWERVPVVENLSPTYRQVIGFWQHVVEKRVNVATGVASGETTRAPSIIVYTPSGYVGVHFPPNNRARFAGAEPTEAEATAATRGYVGYFGALTVYPQMVFHQVLAGVNFQGTTLKRPLELSPSGSEVTIKFPTTAGQQTTTWVVLRRLSGEADMLPKAR